MNDTAKYLIHATIAADGVVERSDVVGAVFGQTEGLLGEELDLRDLQESSKVGRIDVAVESENGQSFGEVTVASSLDKVETAILGAALETIDRIGPCQASVEVTAIEDVRAAKRREVVERAKELLAEGFEETSLASTDVLEEVRDAARVEGIVDYEGLPAGPRVGDSDAVIVVEGRADVLAMLESGIKNAVAVEGTNVPDAIAELTQERTVTAFLDGDRGGELILRELTQVGNVDYVAFAPPGESVEDLDRGAIFESLRGKVPYETLADQPNLREAAEHATAADRSETSIDRGGDGAARTAGATSDGSDGSGSDDDPDRSASEAEDPDRSASEAEDPTDEPTDDSPDDADAEPDDYGADDAISTRSESDATVEEASAETHDGESDETTEVDRATNGDAPVAVGERSGTEGTSDPDDADAEGSEPSESEFDDEPRSLEEHVQEIIDADSDLVRLLDEGLGVESEAPADEAFDAIEGASTPPHTVIVDGEITQRLLDIAAQRGVTELFGRCVGSFVKRPIGTRIRTVGDLRAEA